MVKVEVVWLSAEEHVRYVFISEITYALVNSVQVILMAKKSRNIQNIHFQNCILGAFFIYKMALRKEIMMYFLQLCVARKFMYKWHELLRNKVLAFFMIPRTLQ
jgi:hypothetical protein